MSETGKVDERSNSVSQASESTAPLSPTAVMAIHSPLTALQGSLASGKFSDLTITHGLRRWNAHRVVVCSQSPILESKIEESPLGNYILNLINCDEEATAHMISYLYSSDYTTTSLPPDFSLPTHTKVFNLAIALSLPGLADLAIHKFRLSLANNITSPVPFFSAVRLIYATTDARYPALRQVVVEAAIAEMRELIAGEWKGEWLRLYREVEEFQVNCWMVILEGRGEESEVLVEREVLCEGCGPREKGDGYEVEAECKGCGEMRTLQFD